MTGLMSILMRGSEVDPQVPPAIVPAPLMRTSPSKRAEYLVAAVHWGVRTCTPMAVVMVPEPLELPESMRRPTADVIVFPEATVKAGQMPKEAAVNMFSPADIVMSLLMPKRRSLPSPTSNPLATVGKRVPVRRTPSRWTVDPDAKLSS